MGLSNLSSLRRLNLGNNPIGNLPNFIKGLTRLQTLLLNECTSLKSLLGLPKLNRLDIRDCISLEKITYQSFSFRGQVKLCCNNNLVEWQDYYKLQPIGSVHVEMINLLGLCNLLESMAPIRIYRQNGTFRKADPIPVQGLYQNGIFSTFFGGNEVPGQFSHKSRGSSISFTVPLLDNHRIKGLIVCAVYASSGSDFPYNGMITKVRNKSKGLKWYSTPSFYGIPGEGEDVIWLSHWMFKDEHLEGGDQVVVSVRMEPFQVKELGIQFVQVEQGSHNMMSTTVYPVDPWVDHPEPYLFNDEDTRGWELIFTACKLTRSLSRRQKQQSKSRG